MHWGEEDPEVRGPVIATTRHQSQRNAIGGCVCVCRAVPCVMSSLICYVYVCVCVCVCVCVYLFTSVPSSATPSVGGRVHACGRPLFHIDMTATPTPHNTTHPIYIRRALGLLLHLQGPGRGRRRARPALPPQVRAHHARGQDRALPPVVSPARKHTNSKKKEERVCIVSYRVDP